MEKQDNQTQHVQPSQEGVSGAISTPGQVNSPVVSPAQASAASVAAPGAAFAPSFADVVKSTPFAASLPRGSGKSQSPKETGSSTTVAPPVAEAPFEKTKSQIRRERKRAARAAKATASPAETPAAPPAPAPPAAASPPPVTAPPKGGPKPKGKGPAPGKKSTPPGPKPPSPKGPVPPKGPAPAAPAAGPVVPPGPSVEAKETVRDRVEPAPKPVKSFADISVEWAPHVNEGSEVERRFKQYRIVPKYRKTIAHDTAQHPVSAGIREMLTIQAMAELVKLGHELICSLYSSPRDLKIVITANHMVTIGIKPRLELYRPMKTPSDILRRTEASSFSETLNVHAYQAYLMVDVYHVTDEADRGYAFSPTYVAGLLQAKGPNACLVWVGHRFNGPAGTVHGEGAWKRVNNLICFRADLSTNAYPLHDPCDWIWEKQSEACHAGTLVWAVKTVIGDMAMVVFRVLPAGSVIDSRSVSPPSTFSVREAAVPDYRNRLARAVGHMLATEPRAWYASLLFSSKRILIPEALWVHLQDFASGRSVTDLTTKQLVRKVADHLCSDPAATLFYGHFPEERPHPEVLALAIVGADIEKRATGVMSFNLAYGESAHSYNQAMAKVGAGPPPAWTPSRVKLVLGAASAAIAILGLCARRYWRRALVALVSLVSKGTGSLTADPWTQWKSLLTLGRQNLVTQPFSGKTPFGWIMLIKLAIQAYTMYAPNRVLDLFGSTPNQRYHRVFMLHAVIGAVVEELFKSATYRPYSAIWFGTAEWVSKNIDTDWALGPLIGSLFPFAMHFATSLLSLGKSIALHVGWNATWLGIKEVAAATLRKTMSPSELLDSGFAPDGYLDMEKIMSSIEAPLRKSFADNATGALPLLVSGGLLVGAGLFYLWKRYQRANPPGDHWRQFKRVYYEDPWESRPPVDIDRTVVEPIPPSSVLVPSQNAYTPLPKVCQDMVLSPADYSLLRDYQSGFDEKVRTYFWWLIPLCVPMYTPRRNDHNMAVVAICRILAEAPMPSADQARVWMEQFGFTHWKDWDITQPLDWNVHWWLQPYIDLGVYGPFKPRYKGAWCPPRIAEFIAMPKEEWLDHMTEKKKRDRAIAAFREVEAGGIATVYDATRNTKIMVKTDETLCKFTPNGEPLMKPRAIANVNPKVAVFCGPSVYTMQQRVKKWFGPTAPLIHCFVTLAPAVSLYDGLYPEPPLTTPILAYQFRYSYGSGMTDLDLSRWYRECQTIQCRAVFSASFLVAGDDVLIWINHANMVFFVEVDLSMCDQSVQAGPLGFEFLLHRIRGMDQEVIDVLERTSKSTYLLPSRQNDTRVKIRRHTRPMRDTGGVNTTLGNTDVVITASHWVYREFLKECIRRSGARIEQTQMVDSLGIPMNPTYKIANTNLLPTADLLKSLYSQLGFNVKCAVHRSIEDATFLKGMWYPTARWQKDRKGKEFDSWKGPKGGIPDHLSFSHYWAPLPSRIVKATKTLQQPKTLYPGKDETEAARQFMSDIATCYSYYVKLPILGVLENKFMTRPPVREDLIRPHKVLAARVPKPQLALGATIELICRRYGTEIEEINDFEEKFPSDVFWCFQHPLTWKLVAKDYA